MSALITRRRVARLGSFASTQLAVQLIGFGSGIVLVRCMEQAQYGYYTLAVSLIAMAVIFSDLGLATAVMAVGGRLIGQPRALGGLVTDAAALHRRLATVAFVLLVPCFVVMLWRQHADGWQLAALTVVIVATAWLTARSGLALSVVRLLGHTALQQKLDLGVNIVNLGVLWVAAGLLLDATVATLVNLGVAAAGFFVLTRHLDAQVGAVSTDGGQHLPALRAHLWKQAPNSIWYVVSSQLAVWLIGVFGNAERVAEVGALSRFGALFTVIAAVSAALVLPYFARHDEPAPLASGFAALNVFYVGLLAALVAIALAFPAPVLWVLGDTYAGLQTELAWMLAASALAAWGGALYSIGCARGWVLPVGWTVASGVAATALAASAVDVATVRGSFMINAATGLAGTVVAFAYFLLQLRRHARLKAALPETRPT